MPEWCPKCGALLPEGLEACPRCQQALGPTPEESHPFSRSDLFWYSAAFVGIGALVILLIAVIAVICVNTLG